MTAATRPSRPSTTSCWRSASPPCLVRVFLVPHSQGQPSVSRAVCVCCPATAETGDADALNRVGEPVLLVHNGEKVACSVFHPPRDPGAEFVPLPIQGWSTRPLHPFPSLFQLGAGAASSDSAPELAAALHAAIEDRTRTGKRSGFSEMSTMVAESAASLPPPAFVHRASLWWTVTQAQLGFSAGHVVSATIDPADMARLTLAAGNEAAAVDGVDSSWLASHQTPSVGHTDATAGTTPSIDADGGRKLKVDHLSYRVCAAVRVSLPPLRGSLSGIWRGRLPRRP